MGNRNLARNYLLATARSMVKTGYVYRMTKTCWEYLVENPEDLFAFGEIGTIFLKTGLLSDANRCFDHLLLHDNNNLVALSGKAAIALAWGNGRESRKLYEKAEESFPNNPIIRSNALVQLEYDPDVSSKDRFAKALDWGNWILGGQLPNRPKFYDRKGSLRVGYISPDFCQHTVGLMVREVITSHTLNNFEIFTYHNGQVKDWVTDTFKQKTNYRNCYGLDDQQLRNLILEDGIDILVDLAGHTAGSRLSVFATRPAPVQISWLGYFASTGLPTIDAFLLDQASTVAETQEFFCERVALLRTRFCYSPIPQVPDLKNFPCLDNGYLTFGSFNNTAKLNASVIQLWAKLLKCHKNSRLILKWNTFLDAELKAYFLQSFSAAGISDHRIELRGPSPHIEVLKAYSEIDIALDPFPFNGGQTTCDALLMGTPIITLAQDRPVSRQGASILQETGLSDLIADDERTYLEVPQFLQNRIKTGLLSRTDIRQRFLSSAICDPRAFALDLERVFSLLYREIRLSTQANC